MAGIKVGVQIEPQHCTIDELRGAWRRADALGVDWIWTWDHFFPLSGDADGPHFEGWSLMGAMACDTTRPSLGVLVTCNSYRSPDLVADMAASAEEPGGARLIELEADLRVEGNCWLAAPCGGPRYWDAASHPGPWPRGIFAHTSPVYVACGVREWSQFDASQARAMQALIEGGLERIRHHAVRYPRDHITHHHGEADHRAFLERPFLEALGRVTERLRQTQSPSTRG